MVTDTPWPPRTDPSWLLAHLVDRLPQARKAVLLSSDGLPRAAHGLDPEDADQLAALASGLHALARTAGSGPAAPGGRVRRITVRLDSGLLIVTAAGQAAALAVLADPDADAAALGHEMALLVRSVRAALAIPLRQGARG
ncbi:roadblock/LC7 domain-containing protein [Streptomyces sp. NPDC049881]|uniref:roadblock/LC7 domain-containing protein n=1 Tax=Streptomyces sp. NPDC049881 TaxID=3155778 RepID=UPI00341F1B8B